MSHWSITIYDLPKNGQFCTTMYASTTEAALIPMASPIAKQEILTIKELAEHLKVNERTIYRLASAKKIPAFKVGGSWRFSRPDIDIWIKQQSIVETPGDADDKA